MTDTITRMARGMHARWNASDYADYTYEWDDPMASREMFLDLARAALATLLEPDSAMVAAADAVRGEPGDEAADYYGRIFTAMIAAAMEEGE